MEALSHAFLWNPPKAQIDSGWGPVKSERSTENLLMAVLWEVFGVNNEQTLEMGEKVRQKVEKLMIVSEGEEKTSSRKTSKNSSKPSISENFVEKMREDGGKTRVEEVQNANFRFEYKLG